MRAQAVMAVLALLTGIVGAVVNDPAPASAAARLTISHSNSMEFEYTLSPYCEDGIVGTASYFRVFELLGFGIYNDFAVNTVIVGIATHGSGPVPVTVNLYTLEGEFRWENLTLIGTSIELIEAPNGLLTSLGVTGVAPAGSTLVVEITAPDLPDGWPSLVMGYNDAGQTAPGYIAAVPCLTNSALNEPMELHPALSLTMQVSGTTWAELCAHRYTGELGAPLSNGSCPSNSTALELPGTKAATVCIHPYTGELTWAPRGACSPALKAHIVPNDGPLRYCEHAYTGELRYSRTGTCGNVERVGVIPG